MTPRTPEEERAFKASVATYMRKIEPPRVAVRDPRNPKQSIHVLPTPEGACPECGGHGQVYAPTGETYVDLYGETHDEFAMQPCPRCRADVCPTCGDTGSVTLEVPITDARFGKPVPCPARCRVAREQEAERLRRLYAASKLPRGYTGCTLESFQGLIREQPELWPGKELAYYAVAAFVAAFEDEHFVDLAALAETLGEKARTDWRNWLVLYGERGVGKTGLAAAAVNALVARGVPVRYTRVQDFLKAVQDRYGMGDDDAPPADEYGDLDSGAVVDVVRKSPVLILDEFDVPGVSPNKADIMENVIRYRHGELLPTIITTNLDEDGMDRRWGPTTVSVIRQRSHWIEVAGVPLRPVPQAVGR